MPQHDFDIANQTFPSFRSDINLLLQALKSTNSGPAAPSSPAEGMLWLDTDTPSATVVTLKQYTGTVWVDLLQIDKVGNRVLYAGTVVPGAWATAASSTTVDLGAIASENVLITGTTSITSFGPGLGGMRKHLLFAGALNLVNNNSTLAIPGRRDLAIEAGALLTVVSEGSGVWRVESYAPVTLAAGRKLTDSLGADNVGTLLGSWTGGSTALATVDVWQNFHDIVLFNNTAHVMVSGFADGTSNVNGSGLIQLGVELLDASLSVVTLQNIGSIYLNSDGTVTVGGSSGIGFAWSLPAGNTGWRLRFKARKLVSAACSIGAYQASVLAVVRP